MLETNRAKFISIYDRFRINYIFQEIDFDDFTIAKAQDLLKDKFSLKLEHNPFVVFAIPFTDDSASAVFFGFKDTEKLYGISLDEEFRVTNGANDTKYINSVMAAVLLNHLNQLLNTRVVNQDNPIFRRIEDIFLGINAGQQPESVSLLDLMVIDEDTVSFKCGAVTVDGYTNQPTCKFYKPGDWMDKCNSYDGEYDKCKSLKAIEDAIVTFRKKV